LVDNDYWSQLILLRSVTDLAGALHEAQVLQLKMWGLLVFQKVPKENIEINVNLEDKVVIYLVPTITKNIGNYNKILQGLEKNIQLMLGDNWQLVVKHGGVTKYSGKLKSKNVRKRQNSRNRSSRKKSKSKRS